MKRRMARSIVSSSSLIDGRRNQIASSSRGATVSLMATMFLLSSTSHIISAFNPSPSCPRCFIARPQRWTHSCRPFWSSCSSSSTARGNALRAEAVTTASSPPSTSTNPLLINIYQMKEAELASYLQDILGQPRYRAKQIRTWLYEKGASSFEEMNDLPKALRSTLAEHFRLGDLTIAYEQRSKDGTIKRAYRLADNKMIESVLMPYEDGRRTACISSQAGCAMACVFCQTGQLILILLQNTKQGFSRQLTDQEIYEQALLFARDLMKKGERLSNVVYMGEGEPLNNRKHVFASARRLNQELGIGARHITISTVGLVPRIRDFADEEMQLKLAVSLHAANDEERTALMPVNKRFPIAELMDACQYYVQKTGRRITFEYALIAGQNDSPLTAKELGQLLQPLKGKCHVNVINVNPTQAFSGRPADRSSMDRFLAILNDDWRIPATMRVRRGIDIEAGCGQLRGKLEQSEAEAALAAASKTPEELIG